MIKIAMPDMRDRALDPEGVEVMFFDGDYIAARHDKAEAHAMLFTRPQLEELAASIVDYLSGTSRQHDPIEEKIVFSLANTSEEGRVLMLGIPLRAWEYMKGGKTHTFDLTKAGYAIKLLLYGATDHAAALKVIEDAAAASGTILDDRRRKDFSIETAKP